MNVTKEDLDLSGMPDTTNSVLAHLLLRDAPPAPRDNTALLAFGFGIFTGFPLVCFTWWMTSWFTQDELFRILSTLLVFCLLAAGFIDATAQQSGNTRLTHSNPREGGR